jgi:hypothetical protein
VAALTRHWIAGGIAAIFSLGALAAPALPQTLGDGDPYNNKIVVIATAPSPYWGYVYSPYGDAVRAQGDFLIKKEQAALLREDVRRAKLVTRRQELEHWEWERDFQINAANRGVETVRKAQVERSRNFPPVTEIVAGISLNYLFDELVKQPELPSAGSTPIEPGCLAHVHVTIDGRGNAGLLKGDRIHWPQLLFRPDFDDEREQIEVLFTRAKEQASTARGDPGVLIKLRQRLDACQKRVVSANRTGVSDPAWNPRHYIEAKRFFHGADDAVKILERPDASYFLKPLQGETVAQLVAYMKIEGVRFAPATVGCERFYIALHRKLADEVSRLQPSSAGP